MASPTQDELFVAEQAAATSSPLSTDDIAITTTSIPPALLDATFTSAPLSADSPSSASSSVTSPLPTPPTDTLPAPTPNAVAEMTTSPNTSSVADDDLSATIPAPTFTAAPESVAALPRPSVTFAAADGPLVDPSADEMPAEFAAPGAVHVMTEDGQEATIRVDPFIPPSATPLTSTLPSQASSSPSSPSSLSSPSLPSSLAPTPLPSFASPEAISLDSTLHAKRADLFSTLSTIEQTRQRIATMSEHLSHVQSEYGHARQLLANKQRDGTSQSHLSALLDREHGRLQQDEAALAQRMRTTQAALQSLSAAKIRLDDDLATFQHDMNWSSEQLLQHSLAAKQKEEDRQLLLQYSRQDDARLSELRHRVDDAIAAVDGAKKALEQTETQSAELVMASEQLSREYRAAFDKRTRILSDWEEAVARMHRGDLRLMRLGEEVVSARAEVQAWQEREREVEAFSTDESRNNRKMVQQVEETERANAKVRDEWQREKAAIVELEEEVITKRNVMEKLEMEAKQAAEREKALHQKRREKELLLTDLTRQLGQAQAEYREEISTLKTVTNQHEHLSRTLQQTEAQLAVQRGLLTKAKESLYQLSVQLSTARKLEEQGVIEIANAQGTSKALQGKIHALDISSIKQQEMLYQIEFVIQGLERKVHEASGKRSVEENEMLRAMMEELSVKKQSEEQETALMDAQVKRLTDEFRATKRRLDASHVTLKKKKDDLSTLQVEIEARERQLTTNQRRVDDLRVAHDKAKLDVLKLRSRLQAEQDAAWQEEVKRADIEEAIATRQHEIDSYEEQQRVEFRAIEAERAKLTREVKEKERSVDLLKKKYSTLHAKFVGSDQATQEEDGDAHGDPTAEAGRSSQGYYVVKAGLEREEELKKQNELKQEQNRVELEIEGITRLILEMGHSRGAKPSTNPSALQEELAAQQNELRTLQSEVYDLTQTERSTRKDVDARKSVLATLISEIGETISAVRAREDETAKLSATKRQLDDAMARAEAAVERRLREWRGKARGSGEEEKGGGGGGEGEEAECLLYVAVQEGRRRYAVLREVVRAFLQEREALMVDCPDLAALVDAEAVRPSSAASSIVSHLSEEKESARGSEGGESDRSSRGETASQKGSARALTGGGSRRGTAERRMSDSRSGF